MRRIWTGVAFSLLLLAQPVTATEDPAGTTGGMPLWEIESTGYARVTFTVAPGDYGLNVNFENRRDRPFCKVRGFRVVGLYTYPFSRYVETYATDSTLLHLAGTHQINIRTNCAWSVRLWVWDS